MRKAWFLLLFGFLGCTPGNECRTDDLSCSDVLAFLFFRVEGPRYVYAVNNQAGGSTLMFSANPATGQLTPLTPSSVTTTLVSPRNMALDPLFRFAYVTTGSGGANINLYNFDRLTGQLNRTGITAQGGGLPWGVNVDVQGRFVFVTDNSLNRVISYSIDSAGALSQVSTPAINTPQKAATETTGQFLFVGNQNAQILVFRILSSGSLSPVQTQAVTGGSQITGLVTDPSGQILYAANSTFTRIETFRIAADGNLSAVAQINASGTLDYPVITPDGRYFYVLSPGASTINMYAAAGDGNLTALSPATISVTSPVGMAMDASGKFVYVTQAANLLVYSIGANGQLTSVAQYPQGGLNLIGVAVSSFHDWGR